MVYIRRQNIRVIYRKALWKVILKVILLNVLYVPNFMTKRRLRIIIVIMLRLREKNKIQ